MLIRFFHRKELLVVIDIFYKKNSKIGQVGYQATGCVIYHRFLELKEEKLHGLTVNSGKNKMDSYQVCSYFIF